MPDKTEDNPIAALFGKAVVNHREFLLKMNLEVNEETMKRRLEALNESIKQQSKELQGNFDRLKQKTNQ
jgi:chaperonin cofactor prefoldin